LMFLYNFGAYLVGLLILATNVPQLLQNWFHASQFLQREWILVFSTAIILPFAFFKQLSSFRILSCLSCLSVLGMTCILTYLCVADREEYPIPKQALEFQVNFRTFSAIGGLSYLFVCHDLSFNVSLDFEDATKKRWRSVVNVTMVLTIIVFMLTGYSGFFMFYENSQTNILDNLPTRNILADMARICICLNVLLSVPYMIFMPRVSLYAIIALIFPGKVPHKIFHHLVTVGVLGLGLLIAQYVDDLGPLFEYIGAGTGITIAYILPSIIVLKLEKGSTIYDGKLSNFPNPKKAGHLFILIFGVVAMLLSLSSTTYNILVKG